MTSIRGIPVTTPAQTLVDLAGRTSYERLEAAFDGQLLRGRITAAQLGARLLAFAGSGKPGQRKIRALVETRGADAWIPPASELERRLYAVTGDARLPRFERQAPFPWRRGDPERVDA